MNIRVQNTSLSEYSRLKTINWLRNIRSISYIICFTCLKGNIITCSYIRICKYNNLCKNEYIVDTFIREIVRKRNTERNNTMFYKWESEMCLEWGGEVDPEQLMERTIKTVFEEVSYRFQEEESQIPIETLVPQSNDTIILKIQLSTFNGKSTSIHSWNLIPGFSDLCGEEIEGYVARHLKKNEPDRGLRNNLIFLYKNKLNKM